MEPNKNIQLAKYQLAMYIGCECLYECMAKPGKMQRGVIDAKRLDMDGIIWIKPLLKKVNDLPEYEIYDICRKAYPEAFEFIRISTPIKYTPTHFKFTLDEYNFKLCHKYTRGKNKLGDISVRKSGRELKIDKGAVISKYHKAGIDIYGWIDREYAMDKYNLRHLITLYKNKEYGNVLHYYIHMDNPLIDVYCTINGN